MELSENKQLIVERHNKAVYVDGDRIVKVFKAEKPASDVFNEALILLVLPRLVFVFLRSSRYLRLPMVLGHSPLSMFRALLCAL